MSVTGIGANIAQYIPSLDTVKKFFLDRFKNVDFFDETYVDKQEKCLV